MKFGFLLLLPAALLMAGQEATAPAAKPALHVIGSITAADAAGQTITIKADKTGQEYTFSLAPTKTLLKVPPGAKDLKSASRITAEDLHVADRVDVRYSPDDSAASPIPARSVLLMSASELAEARQAEQQAWQNSTNGTVTGVRPADHAFDVRVRSAEGPKVIAVQTSPATAFTRYSTENPSSPDKSDLAEIQPGDQVRIIGAVTGDSLSAEKVYSGTFRTIPATIVSIDPDNNGLTVQDIQTKQPLHVSVTPETMIRKLPPMIAMAMANRVNGGGAAGAGGNRPGAPSQGAGGNSAPGGGAGTGAGNPGTGNWGGGGGNPRAGNWGGGAGGPGGGQRMGGDPARMLQHMPPVSLSELKAGDAVVLSVAKGKDASRFVASAVVAGVEPIFQATPPSRQSQGFSGGGDWGLGMNIPAQ